MTTIQKITNYPSDKFEFYSFIFKDKEYVSNLYEVAKNHKMNNIFSQVILGILFLGAGIFCFVTKK